MKQHEEALREANRIRTRRAQLKREIHDGDVTIPDLLAEPLSDWLKGMRLDQFLAALPSMGPRRVAAICRKVPVGIRQELQFVTTRQKGVLAREVAAWEESNAHSMSKWRVSA